MVQVGDRVVVEAEKVGREPRTGVVLGVQGALIQIRWDNGGESNYVPSAGSMRVVGREGG